MWAFIVSKSRLMDDFPDEPALPTSSEPDEIERDIMNSLAISYLNVGLADLLVNTGKVAIPDFLLQNLQLSIR